VDYLEPAVICLLICAIVWRACIDHAAVDEEEEDPFDGTSPGGYP
jgi:hypothetical protein